MGLLHGVWMNAVDAVSHPFTDGSITFPHPTVRAEHELATVEICVAKMTNMLQDINEMYFSYWKPPGVSERMWSANSEASISVEYQTLAGHSCRLSEKLGDLMISTGVPCKWLWEVWKHLGALVKSLGAPGRTRKCQQQAWERQRHVWERWRHVQQHLESQWSSLGATTSSLGKLLVQLEIIATNYYSMIFKSHAFNLYS